MKNKEHRPTITFINDSNLEVKLMKMPITNTFFHTDLFFRVFDYIVSRLPRLIIEQHTSHPAMGNFSHLTNPLTIKKIRPPDWAGVLVAQGQRIYLPVQEMWDLPVQIPGAG